MKIWGENGFTLLELLVALTLSALLITVLALGLRSGLVSWMDLRNNNQIVLPQRAVEALLTRQLRVALSANPQGGGSPAVFIGKKESLTFTTSHAPMGTEAAGVVLVTYAQDKAGSDLLYAQRVFTDSEALKGILPVELTREGLARLRQKGWITARVTTARELRFAYQRHDEVGEQSPGQWQDKWEDEGTLPFSVALQWREDKRGNRGEPPWRIFEVAPFQKASSPGIPSAISVRPTGTEGQGSAKNKGQGVPRS